jgi:hypothetical protein
VKTVTTELSKYIKCLIREQLIVLTPEEAVRQKLLYRMLFQLGFPKGLISVEKKIGSRRYDAVCYAKNFCPLVLIECKAHRITSSMLAQATGYNAFLQAPFICLAGPNEVKTLWNDKGNIVSVPFLPPYDQLSA